jgi:hypothetical protein
MALRKGGKPSAKIIEAARLRPVSESGAIR